MTELTQEQIDWGLENIYDEKANVYTGMDFSEVADDWKPDHFDMSATRLLFLQELKQTLESDVMKRNGTITGKGE